MEQQGIPQHRMDEILAYVLDNYTEDVRILLLNNGVEAGGLSEKELRIAFLKAIKDSEPFRADVTRFLTTVVQGNFGFVKQPGSLDFVQQPSALDFVQQPKAFMNFGEELASTNSGVPTTLIQPSTPTVSSSGGSFWNTLGGVANTQNLNNLFSTGLDVLSTKMKADANKDSEERALQAKAYDLQIAQAQAAAAAAGAASPKKGMPGWAIALIVVGSVGVVGTVIYFAVKK